MAGSGYWSRRDFVKAGLFTMGYFALESSPLKLFAREDTLKLTILHTNDVHSHIDPFPMDGSKYQGLGGAARRSKLIENIRKEEPNVLLLDAGDIWQGTPYFNFFGGELEYKLMTEMGYDASTLGNHDFDAGLEGLHKQLPHAGFDFVISNYDFSDTILHDKFARNKIIVKDGIKVGIYGLGIELMGLVPDKLYGGTRYLDPIKIAQEQEKYLRQDQQCDLVICLSHLGYKYPDNKVSDQVLARQTSFTDFIIGGHTHTFMDAPETLQNANGKPVMIFQVGWAGINLGRVDFIFQRESKKKLAFGAPVKIS